MSLVETVTTQTALGYLHNGQSYLPGTTPLGVDYPQPVACHTATVAWIMTDLHDGRQPTGNQIPDNPTGLVGSMLARGIRVNQPNAGALTFVPGSVIVFVANGVPQHSCIAIAPTVVAGYNQVDWFGEGKQHLYTSHNIAQIRWSPDKTKKNQVLRSRGGVTYELWQVPEDGAKAIIRPLL